MIPLKPITQKELKDAILYNRMTGTFIRKTGGRGITKGATVGSIRNGGLIISLNGVQYPARSMAWLYLTGELTRRVGFKDKDNFNFRAANLVRKPDTDKESEGREHGYNSNFEGTFLDANVSKWHYRLILNGGKEVKSPGYETMDIANAKLKEVRAVLKRSKKLTIKVCN